MSSPEGAFAPVVWALKHAPLRPDARGKLDMAAALTLIHLALWADANGGNARPSVAKVAERSGLTDETVRRALVRLTDHGLIEKVGMHESGTATYQLQLHKRRAEGGTTPAEKSRTRRREQAAARQAKFRQKARNAAGHRDVTASDTVTEDPSNALPERYVTQSESVTNAAGERYVTPSDAENRPPDRPLTVQSDRPTSGGAPEGASQPGGESPALPSPSPSSVVGSRDGQDEKGVGSASQAPVPASPADRRRHIHAQLADAVRREDAEAWGKAGDALMWDQRDNTIPHVDRPRVLAERIARAWAGEPRGRALLINVKCLRDYLPGGRVTPLRAQTSCTTTHTDATAGTATAQA